MYPANVSCGRDYDTAGGRLSSHGDSTSGQLKVRFCTEQLDPVDSFPLRPLWRAPAAANHISCPRSSCRPGGAPELWCG